MNSDFSFQDFLTNQSVSVEPVGFATNVALAALLAWILSRVYVHFGEALSNRRQFASNFILIATTTVLIISVVKSSLALSLGLVGALSIVRFRAAIKEPEELAYLFLNIAIGLGLGADQRGVTLLAFVLIVALIAVRHRLGRPGGEVQNLYVTVDSHNPEKIPLAEVVEIMRRHCSGVDLKRFDETSEALEASFRVEFDDLASLERAKSELLAANRDVRITFLDVQGINP
jgi:uncharacterized membrane protein YhiD involved in acid resistance